MPKQAGIAYSRHVARVRLPFDGVARELLLLVLQREDVLKDIDQGFLSCQASLAIQQKVPNLA